MADDEHPIVENLPVLLNLGDFGTTSKADAGWATIYLKTDGTKRIDIRLNKEVSDALGSLIEVFDVRAIGFAGIQRKPEMKDGP